MNKGKNNMNNTVPLTKNGHTKLTDELNRLKKVDRPAISKAIGIARDHGDLSENAEYDAARERQGHIEDRIVILEDIIARSNIIDVEKLSGDRIMFGAKVTLIDEDTEKKVKYQIVGEFESDLTNGLISNSSPLGRALIGKDLGESISFSAPGGDRYYEILEIVYETE